MSNQISIYAPSSGLTLPDNSFGKDIANLGLFRAFAKYGNFDVVNLHTAEHLEAHQIYTSLLPNGGKTELITRDLLDFYSPCLSGVLFRGQPYLSELAWFRNAFRFDSAYSLVGLIHTLGPPFVRQKIGESQISPMNNWDAYICTSPSVKKTLSLLYDKWDDYLKSKLGATNIQRPKLPVIPLGVNFSYYQSIASDSQARSEFRNQLGLSDQDILVLWVGRLSFYEKAFPQTMFRSLQLASQKAKEKIYFVMAGWFPDLESELPMYQESARIHCPDVSVLFLDGRDQHLLQKCWTSADIFLSLVDNIQETFGLSPIEAMASGIPVVASDWDGYNFTIRNGIDGFLISTIISSTVGIGEELAARHSAGILTYQDYVGSVAQHTAVDPYMASEAIVMLANNKDLRKRMGRAGIENVKENFTWEVITKKYLNLFSELESLRAHQSSNNAHTLHPLSANPLQDFIPFATSHLTNATSIKMGMDLASVYEMMESFTTLDLKYQGCHALSEEMIELFMQLEEKGCSKVEELLSHFRPDRHESIVMGITWAAKLGIIKWNSKEY